MFLYLYLCTQKLLTYHTRFMKKLCYLFLALIFCFVFETKAQTLETVNFNGQNRTMIVHAPANIPAGCPLVITLHGANQDAQYQMENTKWNTIADEKNFVVVYPNAINKFWDTGDNSNDLRFIEYVMTLMKERYKIDEKRIYISGFSLGAMMTYVCMDYFADKVAAFAPVSGVRFDNRKPSFKKHVPFIHTHGTGDDVFKWVGDPGHAAGGYPFIPDYVKGCASIMGLTTEKKIAPYPENKSGSKDYLVKYTKPGDPVEVWMLALDGVGHWHSDADAWGGISTTREIWNFFEKYSLEPDVTPKYVDNSFDIPTDSKFSFTFGSSVDYSIVKGYHVKDGVTTELEKTEPAEGTLSFSFPGGQFPEGPCQIKLSRVCKPGSRMTFFYNYTMGITDVSEEANPDKTSFAYIYKGGFLRMLERAQYVYTYTAHCTRGAKASFRKTLSAVIEKYKDFSSTNPYEYEAPTAALEEALQRLEPFVDEAAAAINDVTFPSASKVEYFTIDGAKLLAPRKGLNIVKTTFPDNSVETRKVYAK